MMMHADADVPGGLTHIDLPILMIQAGIETQEVTLMQNFDNM